MSDERRSESGWQQRAGWFSAFACFGCVAGALAYAARMGNLIHVFTSIKMEATLGISSNSTSQSLLLIEKEYSIRHRFAATFYILFPFEVAFVVFAKLLVLERMRDFATHGMPASRPLWMWCCRVYVAMVVGANVIGILGNFVSAAWFSESADFSDKAIAAWAVHDTATGRDFQRQARASVQKAAANNAVQRFSEAVIMLLIVIGFLVVGTRSFRIIAAAMRTLLVASLKVRSMPGTTGQQSRNLVAQASEQGKQLQLKIVATFVFVFITAILRAVFYVMYAVASLLQDTGNQCGLTCHPCRGVYSHIHDWILYTPIFQQVITLIASPLTMLIALWGMSGINVLEGLSNYGLWDVKAKDPPSASP
jgi:hypothetical protein